MCARLFANRAFIATTLGADCDVLPTAETWLLIGALGELLKPITNLVTYFSSERFPQLAALPYQITQLLLGYKAVLERGVEVDDGQFRPVPDTVASVLKTLVAELGCRFSRELDGRSVIVTCAMYVDPRTKTFPFLDDSITTAEGREAIRNSHLQCVLNELKDPRYGSVEGIAIESDIPMFFSGISKSAETTIREEV